MKTGKVLKMIKRVTQDIPELKANILEKHPNREITTMFDVVNEFHQEWKWSDTDEIVSDGFSYEYHFWNFCLDITTIDRYKKKAIYFYAPYTNVDCLDSENYIEAVIFLGKEGGGTICEMDYQLQDSAVTYHFSSKAELKDYFVTFVEDYKTNNVGKYKVVEQESA